MRLIHALHAQIIHWHNITLTHAMHVHSIQNHPPSASNHYHDHQHYVFFILLNTNTPHVLITWIFVCVKVHARVEPFTVRTKDTWKSQYLHHEYEMVCAVYCILIMLACSTLMCVMLVCVMPVYTLSV